MSFILIIFYYYSNFSKPISPYLTTINSFNTLIQENKKIDIGIYGSSHAYCSYDPKIIDRITQTRSFNFGNDAQRLVTTDFVIKETLKKIDPQLLIIDFYSATIKYPTNERGIYFQKDTYDCFPPSVNKIKYLEDLYNNQTNILKSFFSFNRKNFLPGIILDSFKYPSKSRVELYRGFRGFDLTVPKALEKTFDYYFSNNVWLKKNNIEIYDSIFGGRSVNKFKEIIKYLKKTNKKVLFVVAPDFGVLVNENYLALNSYYKKLLNKSGYDLLDFNMIKNLDLKGEDFKDKKHLNIKGATKVSVYLANYIKRNFKLKTRENDPIWVKEQPKSINKFIKEDYKSLKKEINFIFKDNILFESFLMNKVNSSTKLIFKVSNSLNDSVLKEYRLGVRLYPESKDLDELLSYSKAKNRKYDAWDFIPTITEIDGNKYIIKDITSSISRYKKANFFLYNSSGYKGVLGEILELNEIVIK